ncbi:MAG TPA: glutathione peroxidase [Pyrinomonadaceae bacterium]|nr:glutathione peroxidase [Pyrinomonadaceae bacterium]
MANEIYEIPVNKIDGQETNLGDYKGKVLLVVNVASKCGLTPQYEGLQKLYGAYHDQGFEILGFPANNFLGQEPGTEDEIKTFCDMNYNVTFPLFSKISVKGENQHPLYKHLTETHPKTDVGGNSFMLKLVKIGQLLAKSNDIVWNFEKFLIGKNGEIAARFAPDVTPDDARLTAKIEEELNK